MQIPFNKPYLTGNELEYIRAAHANGQLAGEGPFTRKCQEWLENKTKASKALLTHSCTAALEMSAILLNFQPGDEVILPSYTFVSTANAFALRGGVPVFVDIRADTLNMDEDQIERAITLKTKAIVPVHYAGVGCAMDKISAIAAGRRIPIIEDAAQAVGSSYQGRALGSFGSLAALSFHETKNIISGEGGALLVNDPEFKGRSEVIWEKGTNRKQFFRGQVDKYSWVDLGSSYLPGEIMAAFLWSQMENAEAITEKRLHIWGRYHAGFEGLEKSGKIRRPIIPADCGHNAHMYYLLLPDLKTRTGLMKFLKESGILSVFHYVPLDSSPMGKKLGRPSGDLKVTRDLSDRLLRLPLWIGMDKEVDYVIDKVRVFVDQQV